MFIRLTTGHTVTGQDHSRIVTALATRPKQRNRSFVDQTIRSRSPLSLSSQRRLISFHIEHIQSVDDPLSPLELTHTLAHLSNSLPLSLTHVSTHPSRKKYSKYEWPI